MSNRQVVEPLTSWGLVGSPAESKCERLEVADMKEQGNLKLVLIPMQLFGSMLNGHYYTITSNP